MRRLSQTLLLMVIPFLVASCFRSPPVRFYSLQPLPQQIERKVLTTGPRIEILIAEFPSYLSTPQMVLRKTNGEVVIDDFNRWSEELRSNLERTLIENLVVRLNNASVVPVQMYQVSDPSRTLRIEVLQFDVVERKEALLKARWGGGRGAGRTEAPLVLSVFREQVETDTPEARAAALSKALASLCEEISRAIQ
jgi:uncharacterized lipoprotein YmbA